MPQNAKGEKDENNSRKLVNVEKIQEKVENYLSTFIITIC